MHAANARPGLAAQADRDLLDGWELANGDLVRSRLDVIAGYSGSGAVAESPETAEEAGLPDDRTLTVRPVTQADVEGLDALFEGLSDEDRYYRFFSLYRPDRKFLEQMTRAENAGGYRLVAVASGPQESAPLVAEVGYAILPDGNGEFAITVAPAWQGRRLGPRLLDALVAAAAARGVPKLQADILLDNGRMLALISRRGYMMLDRDELDEFSTVRIAIDAAHSAAHSVPDRTRELPGNVTR